MELLSNFSLLVVFIINASLFDIWDKRYVSILLLGDIGGCIVFFLVIRDDDYSYYLFFPTLLISAVIGSGAAMLVCRVREGFWFPTNKAMAKARHERVKQRDALQRQRRVTAQPGPGWYPDPWDARGWRWFDGTQWTGYTNSNQTPTPPPR